jgi:Rod binding domain-containing protein
MNVQLTPSAMIPTLEGAGTPAVGVDHPEESFHQLLTKASSDDKKLTDTAKQFEALMVGQVLKAAHASSQGGWLGLSDGEDQTGEMEIDIAQQGLAQGLASAGALGIAKMVISNVHRHQAALQPTATSSELPSEG